MDFTEHNQGDIFRVDAYGQGYIEVAGNRYEQAILVKNNEVLPLALNAPHEMTEEFLSDLLQQSKQPELIVVGTGDKQQFLPPKLQVLVSKNRIGLEMMATAAACRTFNILLSEDRKAWAILWPTTQD